MTNTADVVVIVTVGARNATTTTVNGDGTDTVGARIVPTTVNGERTDTVGARIVLTTVNGERTDMVGAGIVPTTEGENKYHKKQI